MQDPSLQGAILVLAKCTDAFNPTGALLLRWVRLLPLCRASPSPVAAQRDADMQKNRIGGKSAQD